MHPRECLLLCVISIIWMGEGLDALYLFLISYNTVSFDLFSLN